MSEPIFVNKIDRGEIVTWHRQGDKDGVMAIVEKSWDGTVDLTILSSLSYMRTVFHASHPNVKVKDGHVSKVAAATGMWDFRTEEQKRKFWPEFFQDEKPEEKEELASGNLEPGSKTTTKKK